MKLRRLQIESFKRFREPLVIDDLADGLNLFAAPNEAGKSTVAEAIRAAFFERHRSKSVEHLRPWGDPGATPTVTLDFDINGVHHRLTKAFLNRARCTLEMAGQPALDGAAAEDHLAELLGFKFAGKGASSPEHMGIPGLLWIRQGSSHEVADVVRHAADHLRQVLGESLGELTTSSGDAVLNAIETERNTLLTPAGGKPRGDFAAVLQQEAELGEVLNALDTQILNYRQRVDRLAALRRDHQRDAQSRPWEALREQLQHASIALADAQGLEAKHEAANAAWQQCQAQATAIRAELDAYARDEAAAKTRAEAVQSADDAADHAQRELASHTQRHTEAVAAEARARQQWAQVRVLAERAELDATLCEQQGTLGTAQDTLQRARAAQERATQSRIAAQSLHIAPADLKALKQHSESLREITVRLEAAATVVDIDLLAGQTLRIGDDAVTGTARRTLTRETQIEIAGVGRLTIAPGNADLDTLSAQRERVTADQHTLLGRLGVADVGAAEARAHEAAQRHDDARTQQTLLDALAPQGLEALAADLASRQARIEALQQRRSTLPAPSDSDTALPSAATAEAEAQHTRQRLKDSERALGDARIAAAHAQSQLISAREESARAAAALTDPQRVQRRRDAQAELTNALAKEATAQQHIEAVRAALARANLSLLRQDVERLDRSAKQLEDAHYQRQRDIDQLQAELQAQGALGLEEQRAERARELEAITRRSSELRKRADALDHLLTLLREKRAALAQRLRAPLQKHLDRNLQILFPGAHIDIAENLSPGAITRTGENGTETGDFEHLSLGTREQMGIIARLAYADLLQEAGKPTLLILDDALVNTDEDRLAQMKRVLYDAAQRHQVFIFTCHPGAWRDLGVVARQLIFEL